jgi:hypothetical protein
MGDGELAMVVAVDVPFVCFSAFPTDSDPVGRALSEAVGRLPLPQLRDIKAILEQGRMSAVLVMDAAKNEPNTAYVVIESKAVEQMERLFAIASLFLKSPVEIPGWNSAYSSSIVGGLDVVAAKRSDAVLIGIGKAEDYGAQPVVPDDIKDFAAPHDLVNFVARSSLLSAGESRLGKMARMQLERFGLPGSISDGFDIRSVDALHFRIMTPEYANFGVYWER